MVEPSRAIERGNPGSELTAGAEEVNGATMNNIFYIIGVIVVIIVILKVLGLY